MEGSVGLGLDLAVGGCVHKCVGLWILSIKVILVFLELQRLL